jgi:acetyl esterase/lipase
MTAARHRVSATLEQLESRRLLASQIRAAVFDQSARGLTGELVAADVVYTRVGGPQTLDVYRPLAPAPAGGWPVVLAIHGGGWRRFDKTQYAAKVAPALLDNGFAVVALNYRLSTPGSPSWPVNLEEIQQAGLWVQEQGLGDGLNPGRVVAMGESAGGHLAALLATGSGDPNGHSAASTGGAAGIRGVVDFFGPADLTALFRESSVARPAVTQLLGASPEQAPDLYAAASPVAQVAPGDPPFLIVQGSADPVVPPSQSRELANALNAAGVPNELDIVPGAGHGFGLQGPGRDLVPKVVSFLDQVLGHVG